MFVRLPHADILSKWLNIPLNYFYILHRVPPNGHLFVLWNNSVKRERILIISVHRMLRKLDIRILYVTWNLLPHYLVKFRTSFRWLFVTGILLRNFLLKQLKCEIKTSKSMDFCCFPYTKVVRFSSQKKWMTLKRAGWCDVAASASASHRQRHHHHHHLSLLWQLTKRRRNYNAV